MSNTETLELNTPVVSYNDGSNLPNSSFNSQFDPQTTYDQLNQFFNDQDKQEKEVQEAREILGDSAKDLSDSEVYDLVNEVQFLVDSWLDEYERDVFDGKTLDEVIGLEQK